MPVGEKPILDIIARQLKLHGITEITLAVGHLAELLMSYFGDGQRLGVHISYSREEEPLGTAGPLSLIPDLHERFLVMNGDVLTTLDFNDMVQRHIASGALCTIAVHPKQIPIELGVIEYNSKLQLTSYVKKPVHEYRASMGIYIFEPRVLSFIPEKEYQDLPDLMMKLIQAGEIINCYPFSDYWLDIGRPTDYAKAVADLDQIEPLLFPAR
jgi:NDP-sugar pyrophosphorylase family protein